MSRTQGGPRLAEGARLLCAALEGLLDQPVRLTFTDDYERLLQGILVAGLDVVWMPPLLHARAVEAGATLAAVSQRGGKTSYRAAILVRGDSRFQALVELGGARAAWSDPESAAGHIYPARVLSEAGVTLGGEQYCGTQAAALAAVAEDRADVCACYISEAAGADPALALDEIGRSPGATGSFRLLQITDSIPPDGIVLAPNLDTQLATRLGEALLQLHRAPAGKVALQVLMGAERLVSESDPR